MMNAGAPNYKNFRHNQSHHFLPGASLSLQMHHHSSEHWIVVWQN